MNGKKIYAKQILANPEEYFTPDVMQALDEIAAKEFSYGSWQSGKTILVPIGQCCPVRLRTYGHHGKQREHPWML